MKILKASAIAIALCAGLFAANVTITPATAGQWSTTIAALTEGDTLTLAPGTYAGTSTPSSDLIPKGLSNDGTAERRIVIRAESKNTVFIRARGEWMTVNRAYYTFENLDFDLTAGTHAFHVKPGGKFGVVRNCHFSKLSEAPVKLSTEANTDHQDHFIFENNESERSAGAYPAGNLNGFNLNGAAFVVVRGNYIHEISKSYSQPFYDHNDAYGGFIKAGAKYCIIENNLVKYINGMGLSLGGGLTGEAYFRENTHPVEAMGCIMRNNVIVGFPNRNYGNRGLTINQGNGNLVYNNTLVNCITPAIFGKTWVMNPITGDSVMTGVGNVVMNNLNVNMFHADSQWAIDFGYKSGGTLRDGLMFIWSDWTGFDPVMDALIRDRNALSGNLRVDVPALTDLFFNPDSDDWRLKPSGLSLLKPGVFVDPASVAGLAAGVKGISGMNASRDAGFIDSLIDAGLIGRYFDKAGNERPAVPAPGAYEAYDSDGKMVPVVTALEDSRRVRTLVRLDGITAAASPNPAAGGVRIGYTLPEDLGHLEITLWDVQGRMVYNLFHGAHPKGSYARFWNGLNHESDPVPAGVYVIRLRSGIRHFETRVSLVR